jgi:hypothetical protein
MAPKELRTVLSPLFLPHEDPTEENSEGILNRAAIWIWITANSYVRLDKEDDDCTVEDRHEKQFWLYLRDTDQHEHFLSIHASTPEESIICLDYLVGLQDTHFEMMALLYKDGEEARHCPFGANILEKMLQKSARRISFTLMIFTPDHCRILASSGTKTNIEFYRCEFQDEGAAFVEASASRQDETSGPAMLRFMQSNPFNDRNWALFLSHHKLESLELDGVDLESEVSCRAVATSKVRCLTFSEECELEDGGAALIESVKEGLGPKGLCFDCDPFDSQERLVTFVSALRGNTNLERLELPLIDEDIQQTQALVAALRENKGLVHLKVKYFRLLDDSDITELLESISLHPSLRSLDFEMQHFFIGGTDLKKRREFTKAVTDMLSVNERVQVMSFCGNTFDEEDWDAFVAPRLECNLYREQFLWIRTIEEASTRAAVLARTLAKFSSKPHLLWMLLNQNRDILSSYLDSAHDQTSIPSRKRGRSPSLDGMSAH